MAIASRKDIGSLFLVFAILSVLVGLVGLIALAVTEYRMHLLNRQGIEVIGYVENTYRTSGKGPHTPMVSYKFTDAHGVTYEGRDAYPFVEWDNLRPNDTIRITYLPSDPSLNYLTRRVQLVLKKSIKDYVIPASLPWLIALVFVSVYYYRKRCKASAI